MLLKPFEDDPEALKAMLAMEDDRGQTILHCAARWASTSLIEKLFQHFEGDPERLKAIITMEERRKDPLLKNKPIETLLHEAARFQNIPLMKKLLQPFENDAEAFQEAITWRNAYIQTPLHDAVNIYGLVSQENMPNKWGENGEDNVLDLLLRLAFKHGLFSVDLLSTALNYGFFSGEQPSIVFERRFASGDSNRNTDKDEIKKAKNAVLLAEIINLFERNNLDLFERNKRLSLLPNTLTKYFGPRYIKVKRIIDEFKDK
jgi:ankyrin repeat protein